MREDLNRFVTMCDNKWIQGLWTKPMPGDRFIWYDEIRFYVRNTQLDEYFVSTTDKDGGTWIGTMTDWEKRANFKWLPWPHDLINRMFDDASMEENIRDMYRTMNELVDDEKKINDYSFEEIICMTYMLRKHNRLWNEESQIWEECE